MKPARRRKARELLVQALYAAELGKHPLARTVADQIERRHPHDESLEYILELQPFLESESAEWDRKVDAVLQTRAPERVGTVERVILRLALVELRHREDVPLAVIMDEALALTRHFSTEDSARFVNGILDRLGPDVRPSS